jgi:hypothetical protein
MSKAPLEVAREVRNVIEPQGVRDLFDTAGGGEQLAGMLKALLGEPGGWRASQMGIEPALELAGRNTESPRGATNIVAASEGDFPQSVLVHAERFEARSV